MSEAGGLIYLRQRIFGLWGGPSDLGLNMKSINAFGGSFLGLRIGFGLELAGLTGLRGLDLGLTNWGWNAEVSLQRRGTANAPRMNRTIMGMGHG